MKITIKPRATKLYQQLINEEVPKAVGKYQKRKQFSKEEAEILETNLRLQLANGTYSPTPAKIYEREGTKFAKYKLEDEILLSALYRLLAPKVNQKLLPQCIGGRKGHSRHDFLGVSDEALEKKLNWVLVTDVADYFYSIRHPQLEKDLKESPFRIPKDVRKLVMGLVAAGKCGNGQGILPGNALVKVLGNVYLHSLDKFLNEKELLFCRYIDDICIFHKTQENAKQSLEDIKNFIAKKDLKISEPKTGIYHRHFNRFSFLGFSIIGKNMQPTEGAVEKFKESLRTFRKENQRKGVEKFVRKLNKKIYFFGHQYKTGSVKLLYRRLDEVIRKEFRRFLKKHPRQSFSNGHYSNTKIFPDNLAFSNRELYDTGLASLEEIKRSYEQKLIGSAKRTETTAKSAKKNKKTVQLRKGLNWKEKNINISIENANVYVAPAIVEKSIC